MDSLLVMAGAGRCYSDCLMWEPEWSELTKGKRNICNQSRDERAYRELGHAGEMKGSCSVVSAWQSYNGKPGREQTVEKD
jgi:hypothetical protein